MTNHAALRELADRLTKRAKRADVESGGTVPSSYLRAIATQLRTAASEGVPVAWQFFNDGVWLPCTEQYAAIVKAPARALYTHPPEVARDARDAGRYRWLRDNCSVGSFSTYDPPFRLNCDEPASEWDAAIDRAISGAAGD